MAKDNEYLEKDKDYFIINGEVFVSMRILIEKYNISQNNLWLFIREGIIPQTLYQKETVMPFKIISRFIDKKIQKQIKTSIDKNEEDNIELMTKKDIMDLLDIKGIKYVNSMKKDELIKLLKESDK